MSAVIKHWLVGSAALVASIAAGLVCADLHVVLRLAISVVASGAAIAAWLRVAQEEDEFGVGIALCVGCFIVVMAQPTDLLHTRPVTTPDGVMRTEHLGGALTFSRSKSGSTKYLSCVAPIVPGRSSGEPATAWVLLTFEGITICQAVYFAEISEAWSQGRRDVIALDRIERDDAERAVADAEHRYGLVSAPGAPIVKVVPEGLAARAAHARDVTEQMFAWTIAIWTLVLAIAAIVRRRRRARSRG